MSTLALVTKKPATDLKIYLDEIQKDRELVKHLKLRMSDNRRKPVSNQTIKYGRRIGWYILTRATKPKLVIETGVDKGLGACVLASALLRNANEGHPGRYIGTDLNPNAGRLFSGKYSQVGEIMYGDSITSLKKVNKKIDLFINDSDHSAHYEGKEYATIKNNLTRRAIVLGDNAHVTTELLKFSRKMDKNYLFWREEPKDHWYPGAGIGIMF
jgi:predicted O-methyltransferase YrrM